MGSWRADQSKAARRYVWQQTRGETDDTRRDFVERLKPYPTFAAMRVEKIGGELHLWRPLKEDESGKAYWTSCLRFVDDGWGYWTVYYRLDERRWRTTSIKEMPLGRAIVAVAEFWPKTPEK